MISTDEELERLDDLLCGLPAAEAMTLEELDGYVGALIVCPEIIPPSEWLPGVWGGEGVFANADEANEIIGAVMGHYNRMAQVLADDPEVLRASPRHRSPLRRSAVGALGRRFRTGYAATCRCLGGDC